MYHSAEIRWVFEGDLARPVVEWFSGGHEARAEPERVDEYLALPGCETMGIKFSEGRLEVKALTAAPVPTALAGGSGGLREGWVKWSLATDEAGAASDDDWVLVRKRRRLRKFAIDASGTFEVDPLDRDVDAGCQFELAALRVLSPADRPPGGDPPDWLGGEPWWSVSFEAFGDTAHLVDHLDRATAAVLRRPPPHGVEPGAVALLPGLAGAPDPVVTESRGAVICDRCLRPTRSRRGGFREP